ncbi:(2Fe-2S)-binding protein [Rhodococcus opacus]|uniref:(2Fe-2S)-binding protein n=1 Tax=Rhodococcus opacus TaxID=37919 RepID=UPI0009C0EC53|nr:(2Fe-2S)-binding protein [Rhodococcus opacus]MDX5969945.1 (2Fe-2S)-binding protein [Rhodococcus opacus]NKY76732.1 (2Fe-2S)-binding protein [Rhodococcus opacus]CAG7631996.1 hypothetical protein E143388_07356 [Rhodococcus opacus]
MYVCLCLGVTTRTVTEAVADGAATSKQVRAACGAGSGCNRCWPTIRAIIAAADGNRAQIDPSGGTRVDTS